MKADSSKMNRRAFLAASGTAAAAVGTSSLAAGIQTSKTVSRDRPNLIFVTADQARAQSFGFMGNRQVHSPNFDRLARESVVFTESTSVCPICTPARAIWLTGRNPTSTGVISNDIQLPVGETSSAEVLKDVGYATGYVGKWHLDGPLRQGFTPPGPRRQGFDYWAAANICHHYTKAFYYRDSPEKIDIAGYQPDHETDLAIGFIENHRNKPFHLNLHWGPPHDPYIVPEKYMQLYDPARIELRDNVMVPDHIDPRKMIAAYYAGISAVDWNMGRLMKALDDMALAENTILVFTSDHGDMLYSLGLTYKQWPYEECVRVPLLVRYPRRAEARKVDSLISSVDIMPTMLSLCGAPIPDGVQGTDFAETVRGGEGPSPDAAMIMCVQPCARYHDRHGTPAWRGLRTRSHTYARFRNEDWCLYDNEKDPFQRRNLFADRYEEPEVRALRQRLDATLQARLRAIGDGFDAPPFPKIRWSQLLPQTHAIAT